MGQWLIRGGLVRGGTREKAAFGPL